MASASPIAAFASLALAALGFVAFASQVAIAATTSAAQGEVDDGAALRLLKIQYGGSVALKGAWEDKAGDRDSASVDADAKVSREVCADSGATAGPRLLAVCTAYPDAGHVSPGAVDLWLLLGPQRPGESARIGASRIDIATGSFGTPGEVRLIAVGPGRSGFVLSSGYTTMGWSLETQALYAAEGESFTELFQIGIAIDNTGACDRDTSRACLRQSVSLECRLRADIERVDGGFYDFTIEIRGARGGKDVKRTLRIPRRDGTYRVPTAELKRIGCDESAA